MVRFTDIYQFKVKNFTTILIGQLEHDEFGERIFYIQRADGTKYKYEGYRVEWYKKIASIE
jgi:hypothetical protein